MPIGKKTDKGLLLMAILMSLMVSACSVLGARQEEQPEYTVVEKDDSIEIRRYASYIMAKTVISGDLERAGRIGFNRLFNYISGNNRSKSKIAMTAPVIQEPAGEKIAMTSPVIQEADSSGWLMAFVLPSKYTMETAPEPLDSEVTLVEIPVRLVATIRYSGLTNADKMKDMETRLREWLAEKDYDSVSSAQSARYDPPWTLPPLRRNEILIEVTPAKKP